MGRICAIYGCSNSNYRLNQWYSSLCEIHGQMFGSCVCKPPFQLFPFPSEMKVPEGRKRWNKLVNRKIKGGKIWQAVDDDRICSSHFVDGEPTELHPYPSINLGYDPHNSSSSAKGKQPRKPPRKRELGLASGTERKAVKKRKVDPPEIPPLQPDDVTEVPVPDTVPTSREDHTYMSYPTDCSPCEEKSKTIRDLQGELRILKQKLDTTKHQSSISFSISNIVLEADQSVRLSTGIQSRSKFHALYAYLAPKVRKIRYWSGQRKSTSHRTTPSSKGTPRKPGPTRCLFAKEELLLVLMKLRMALTLAFLASLFMVSLSTASQIFNTWIKFLAFELKPLIFWPDKEVILRTMPKSLKRKYRTLRCTLDCTEVFIGRPRDLELQAITWSDYNKHNTVKFLVAIAPNGMISFLSKAWGGRASDVHITKESGFLNLVDPGDIVLADRGFTIKEELLLRQAMLEIPPPSKGVEQQSPEAVSKTKKIANARIHVERAIGRMKCFCILQETLPITLVPVVDDIIIVCGALVNLQPPLVSS